MGQFKFGRESVKSSSIQELAEYIVWHVSINKNVGGLKDIEHLGESVLETIPEKVTGRPASGNSTMRAYRDNRVFRNAQEAEIVSRCIAPSDIWYHIHPTPLLVISDRSV